LRTLGVALGERLLKARREVGEAEREPRVALLVRELVLETSVRRAHSPLDLLELLPHGRVRLENGADYCGRHAREHERNQFYPYRHHELADLGPESSLE